MATKITARKGNQTITVEVDGGDTVVSTKGFQGKACKDATKQLEAALGKVSESTPTPEMYQSVGARMRERS